MSQSNCLAREITRKSSLQTYLTIKLLVDRGMAESAYRAYAYFRWLDDEIDTNLKTSQERAKLIKRQKEIITSLYEGGNIHDLTPEEEMLRELIDTDTRPKSKLKSYITKFFSIIEFDAQRYNKTVGEKDLCWYSKTIGEAVTDCIQYFIGSTDGYTDSPNKYKAAIAAHIVHLLRDLKKDIQSGFINIPREYLEKKGIDILDINDQKIGEWVKGSVTKARSYFAEGKSYIRSLSAFRCKLAAMLYCLRFEPLLSIIEKDNYTLRQNYRSKKDTPN